MSIDDIPTVGGTGFLIADTSRSDGGRTLASPDVAMCADCAAEQRDPADRRYRHAFVNCTNCGPRFTIIASLPYDRASTTMAAFAMCADCAREYDDPDRPPIPRPAGLLPALRPDPDATATRGRRTVSEDGSAATPGGCCATAASSRSRESAATTWPATPRNDDAVSELRRRKRRGDKPFAVMVRRPGIGPAPACRLDDASERLLSGPQRPIVLMPASPSAPRSPSRWHRTTPISASCWPTPRCTRCCSGCPATNRDRPRW